MGSQLALHFLLLSHHQHFPPWSSWFVSDSVIVSVFQNRWNPGDLRSQSRGGSSGLASPEVVSKEVYAPQSLHFTLLELHTEAFAWGVRHYHWLLAL